MSIKELDKLAKMNEPMPKLLEYYEEAYYIASRYLYRQFDAKTITIEQAKEEKERIIKAYKDQKEAWAYMLNLYNIKNALTQLKEQGFNSVLEWQVLEEINKALGGANNG